MTWNLKIWKERTAQATSAYTSSEFDASVYVVRVLQNYHKSIIRQEIRKDEIRDIREIIARQSSYWADILKTRTLNVPNLVCFTRTV